MRLFFWRRAFSRLAPGAKTRNVRHGVPGIMQRKERDGRELGLALSPLGNYSWPGASYTTSRDFYETSPPLDLHETTLPLHLHEITLPLFS